MNLAADLLWAGQVFRRPFWSAVLYHPLLFREESFPSPLIGRLSAANNVLAFRYTCPTCGCLI